MTKIKMGAQGRLKIPLDLWDEIGVSPGDTVEITISEEGVLLIGKVKGDLNEHMGSVPVDGRQDFEEVREEVKKARGKRRGG